MGLLIAITDTRWTNFETGLAYDLSRPRSSSSLSLPINVENCIVRLENSYHFLTSRWQWFTGKKVCFTQTKPLLPTLVDHFRGKKGKRKRISNAVRSILQCPFEIKWKMNPIYLSHIWALSMLCVVLNQIISSMYLWSF